MNPALSRWSFLLALVWMTTALSPGFGQNPSHGPIPGPSSAPNPSQLQQLTERFQNAKQWDQVQELIQKSKVDPTILDQILENSNQGTDREEVLRALVEQKDQLQLKLDDPLVRQLIERLAKEKQGGPQASLNPDLVHQLDKWVSEMRIPKPDQTKGNPANNPGATYRPTPQPNGQPSQDPPKPEDQPTPAVLKPLAPPPQLSDQSHQFPSWLKGIEKWAESKSLLQNSPALRQALEDLAHTRLQGNAEPAGAGELTVGEKTAQWIGDRLPSKRFLKESVIPKVRDFPLPALPNIDLPNVHLSTPSLPSLDVPSMSMPAPSSSGGETVFLSLFTVAVVGLVLWKLYGGWLSRKGRLQGLDWAQGDAGLVSPRSLDLSSLTSREDLIRAFEQLSLVKLGSAARSWNHLHLAASLGGDANERRRLANHLAFLYEQARYAPCNGPLSPDALRIAHRQLAILAGVANV